MFSSNMLKRVLSLIAIVVMLLGYSTSLAYAENSLFSLANEDLNNVAQDKIMPEVLDDLEKNDMVEVLVYMKEQTDTKTVAENAKERFSERLTPYATKLAVRREVVEALRDTAERTQLSLLNYLEEEKTGGNVIEYKPYHIVNMVYIKANREVIENIAKMNEVERIYKNRTHKLESPIISDSDLPSDEEMQSSDDEIQWNIERVRANLVWDLGYDGTGVVVGSIDSGVDWTHPALKNKWRGYDPETGETNYYANWFDPVYGTNLPEDSDTHGTHVMGTIVGQEPDGSNKIGVAPGAKWISARVFDVEGLTTDEILLEAAEWMLHPAGNPDNAPDIINNSWGALDPMDDWYRDAVRAWVDAGIFPVFSAGNQRQGEPLPWPGTIENPASYPESFAVAATDFNDLRADFSKLGPSPYDETLIKPEISAPGVRIRSSIPGNRYVGNYSGTSMAAPHVSGVAALILSANNSLSVDELRQVIESEARPLTDSEYIYSPNFAYGYGMVDAFASVTAVVSGTGTIKGQVLTQGQDEEIPVIIHEQEIYTGYVNSKIDIYAELIDDVSIVEAEILVKLEGEENWNRLPMVRISGDHRQGMYTGTIPGALCQEPGITYKIYVKDFDGNEVVTEDCNVEIKFGIKPDEYETGFEIQPVGWVFNKDWEWGEPAEGVGPRPYEGTKLAGTNLDGTYSRKTNSLLISPPIDLRDETMKSATLRFYHWYETVINWDFATVYVSDDYGENWIQASPQYSGDGRQWQEMLINLTDYIGSEDPIFVAFELSTNHQTYEDGWYIDNVRLINRNDPIAPQAPTNLSAQSTISGIRLNWNPSQELDFDMYKIYRSQVSGGGDEGYIEIGSTKGTQFIDMDVEGGNTYYYVVTALDFSENESSYSNEVSATAVDAEIIYFENFEDDNGGFITGVTEPGKANNWEWGVPTSGPGHAYTGTKVWATNLSGSYDKNHSGYIDSPELLIPEEYNTVLSVDYWMDSEGGSRLWDYGIIQISDDGGNSWRSVTENLGGRIQQWQNRIINLDQYKGKSIKIRFYFYSDNSNQYDGWYIDNILIAKLNNQNMASEFTIEPTVEPLEKVNTVEFAKKEYIEEKEPEKVKLDYKLFGKEEIQFKTIADENVKKIPLTKAQGVPLDATVTVLETGVTVKTNPATGKFMTRHAASEEGETWTLLVESYGYYTREIEVSLDEGEVVEETIVLDKIPEGRIVGQVKDRFYENPASNAVIRVKDDPNVEPVVADENGNFTIEGVLEGNHVLKVTAPGFEPVEMEVYVAGEQDNEVEIGLKRIVSGGVIQEISYDDGTEENALIMNEAGNGFAVRFTPDEYVKVVGANIFFWRLTWPNPGGDEIGIALYEVDDNGNINMIGEPKIVNINRGRWNYIDLSEYGLSTSRDFFISTIQTDEGDYSPGLAIDELSPYGYRSYLNVGGNFSPLPDEGVLGGFMIRAVVENAVNTPVITNVQDTVYTNQDSIVLEGKVESECKVNIYVNGEKHEIETENREFSIEVNLAGEETIVFATSELNGMETEPSSPVKIIKDITSPTVEIQRPSDGEKTNREVVHVIGNAYDKYLDKVVINDTEIRLDENGYFHERLILNEGENIITVRATDLAGNITEKSIKVTVKLNASVIENIQPQEDVVLYPGETLTVSFNAESGGSGVFKIIPDITAASEQGAGIPVEEISPGYYEGSFTIPYGFTIDRGIIEIEFVDSAGNKTTAQAPGRLTVESEDVEPEIPELTNIEPSENMILGYGDILEVSFNAPAQGQGYFVLNIPLGPMMENRGIRLIEESPGFYRGTWVVPEGIIARDIEVEIIFISREGVEVTRYAPGKLTIARVEPIENLPVNAVIVGNEAFDINYLNNNADAQQKLINWFNEGNEVFIKLGADTIVNERGELVDPEELPDVLIYYDSNGMITIYSNLPDSTI